MVRIGLIGTGRWGTNILNTLRHIEGVSVDTADHTHPLPSDVAWDGIIVATPGSTHAEVALPFLAASIPTYIEKPMATTLADARKIERVATKSGTLLFSGHIHRYNPAYLQTKKEVSKAGRIRYLYFEGTNNGPFRDDMSALWDWAPHDVYLAIDLMKGKLPAHVQAWGITTLRPKTTLYDFSVIKMTWSDGRVAISTTSWLLPVKQKKTTIVGEKDTVVFDDAAEKKVIVYGGMGPHFAKASRGRPLTLERQEPKISYPSYSNKPSLQAELEEFIGCIRENKQPPTGLADGLAVVRVLAAAEKSMALNGQKIRA